MAQILVTGANGFVGSAFCSAAARQGHRVRAVVRAPAAAQAEVADRVVVADIGGDTDWTKPLAGVDVVVHLAARVHVMRETAADALAAFRAVNVRGTAALAAQAAAAGVRRFILVSSIKVNGEQTTPGRRFQADDVAAPSDAYGLSKFEAEQAVQAVAARTAMEAVIVRPPLVYGPGVRANFESMMRWIHKGLPLPLRLATDNRRSLVALDNLTDLLARCVDHPGAANRTFLVSDDDDVSTAELLIRLGVALGRPARLLPVPVALLRSSAAMLGRADLAQRLLGSLQVEIERTRSALGWSPPVDMAKALADTAAHFLRRARA